ncbi:MAG: hypothetical protein ACI861_001664, partial [Paracoccaceae bacterium]
CGPIGSPKSWLEWLRRVCWNTRQNMCNIPK